MLKRATQYITFVMLPALVMGGVLIYGSAQLTPRVLSEVTYIDRIEPESIVKDDPLLLAGVAYTVPGDYGYQQTTSLLLTLGTEPQSLHTQESTWSAIPEITYTGAASAEQIGESLMGVVSQVQQALADKDLSVLEFFFSSEIENTEYNHKLANNLKFMQYQAPESISDITYDAETGLIPLGKIRIKYANCGKRLWFPVVYNTNMQAYQIDDVNTLVNSLCDTPPPKTCSTCRFYPVDKTHELPSSYKPTLVAAAGIDSGRYVDQKILKDLQAMFNASVKAGYPFKIVSAYRSYNDQVATYNNWVNIEVSRGYSYAVAKVKANQYSALPGHSEHQLGTTLDFHAAGCGAFDACNGNQKVWDWLANNAYKYGFVMSYPAGWEDQSGYVHEPWHYRWIGRELAGEYHQVQNKMILRDFLLKEQYWW